MFKLNRKGQNTLEYVLLITCVVVAFLAIQHYLGRGLQGRVREASDNIGSQFDVEDADIDYLTVRQSIVEEETLAAGGTSSTLIDEVEITTRTGTEIIDEWTN